MNLNFEIPNMKSILQIFRFPEPPDLLDDNGSPATLRLNFRNAPLQTVVDYLREAADLNIEAESNVEIERRIDLWNDEPVNKEQALSLFKQSLSQKGFAAIRKGRRLAILRSQDAKKHCIPLPTLACSAVACG